MSTAKKMYVLVRKDLDPVYRGVQGTHAVAEYSLRGNKRLYDEWDNSTLVFVGVKNEGALEFW